MSVYGATEYTSLTNRLTEAFFDRGAYHLGINVAGVEFSFGSAGVLQDHPGMAERHVPLLTIPLGSTATSPDEFVDQAVAGRSLWDGSNYRLAVLDCTSFSRRCVGPVEASLGQGLAPYLAGVAEVPARFVLARDTLSQAIGGCSFGFSLGFLRWMIFG